MRHVSHYDDDMLLLLDAAILDDGIEHHYMHARFCHRHADDEQRRHFDTVAGARQDFGDAASLFILYCQYATMPPTAPPSRWISCTRAQANTTNMNDAGHRRH